MAHRALSQAGFVHPSLEELRQGYRSILLASSEPGLPLLCDLLEVPGGNTAGLDLPELSELVPAPLPQILEACRSITMLTSCGARTLPPHESAGVLPLLAFSYARDWNLEACCALFRACAYLRMSDRQECRWSLDWLQDQQQPDGRFGLLRAEANRCGWDPADWRTYFDPTVHAVWALSEAAVH
jgi:hypothetical protein